MRQPRERLACQRRLETPRLSQIFEKSGRPREFQFPRAASQAVRTAVKRSGPAAKARGSPLAKHPPPIVGPWARSFDRRAWATRRQGSVPRDLRAGARGAGDPATWRDTAPGWTPTCGRWGPAKECWSARVWRRLFHGDCRRWDERSSEDGPTRVATALGFFGDPAVSRLFHRRVANSSFGPSSKPAPNGSRWAAACWDRWLKKPSACVILVGIVAFIADSCFIVGINWYYAVKLKRTWRDPDQVRRVPPEPSARAWSQGWREHGFERRLGKTATLSPKPGYDRRL